VRGCFAAKGPSPKYHWSSLTESFKKRKESYKLIMKNPSSVQNAKTSPIQAYFDVRRRNTGY